MMTASIGSSRVRSMSIVASEAPRMATRCQPGANPQRKRVIGGGVIPFTRNDGERWRVEDERDARRVAVRADVQREMPSTLPHIPHDLHLGRRNRQLRRGGEVGARRRHRPLVCLLRHFREVRGVRDLGTKHVRLPARADAVVDVFDVDVARRVGFVRRHDQAPWRCRRRSLRQSMRRADGAMPRRRQGTARTSSPRARSAPR